MSIPKSVADVIQNHVVLEVEGIDRMFLNVYQPGLQHGGGAASFFRFHRGEVFATARTMARMTREFIGEIYRFTDHNQIPVVPFGKGDRKDDVALARYAKFEAEEGVVFIGKAQEKATVRRGRKPPSITLATSVSVDGYTTCPRFGQSAFKPTDVSWTSNKSATTRPSAKTPFASSPVRWRSTVNVRARCVLATRPWRHCFCRCWSFVYTQRGHNLRKPVRWPSEAVALGWRFSTASEGHRTKPQFVTACSILPTGFSNRDLRKQFAPLSGKQPDQVTPGQMTYQLRRLRLRGLIRRIPKTHRYEVTDRGMRTALFYAASASAILRPLADVTSPESQTAPEILPKILQKLDQLLAQFPELQQAT